MQVEIKPLGAELTIKLSSEELSRLAEIVPQRKTDRGWRERIMQLSQPTPVGSSISTLVNLIKTVAQAADAELDSPQF